MARVIAGSFVLCVLALSTARAQFGQPPAKLKVGDPAPPLTISDWVKGKPANLASDNGKKVYVIEFWATWCGPCQFSIPELTSIQAKYGQDRIVVVGVTSADFRGNTLASVKRYVQQWGTRMDYRIAFDKGTATNDAYMIAANQYTIPTAFVVDRNGRVAWIGSPVGPEMGDVVDLVITDKFDPSKYLQTQATILAKFNRAEEAAGTGNLKGALAILDEVLAIDPGHTSAIAAVCMVYLRELQDPAGLRTWAAKFIDQHRSDGRAMGRLSQQLLGIIDLPSRLPGLALASARAAYDIDGRQDAEVASAYALALYQVGAIDAAIKVQSTAVAAATGDKAKDLKTLLDFYKSCQKAQKSVKP